MRCSWNNGSFFVRAILSKNMISLQISLSASAFKTVFYFCSEMGVHPPCFIIQLALNSRDQWAEKSWWKMSLYLGPCYNAKTHCTPPTQRLLFHFIFSFYHFVCNVGLHPWQKRETTPFIHEEFPLGSFLLKSVSDLSLTLGKTLTWAWALDIPSRERK